MILHTEAVGTGEPVIFLHTGLQTGNTDFEYQSEYFKHDFKVFKPDLRGHGKSDTNDYSNFFQDSARDLLETMDHFKIEKAHIVGCSLGALVGLIFTKNYPHKVQSLTLSGILPEKPSNWLEAHQKDVEYQSKILESKEVTDYFNSLHGEGWKQFINMGREVDWYPFNETSELTMNLPILFLVGEGNVNETKGAIIYPKLNKQVHVSIIPFAAHLVHSEQPEVYSKILEIFLKKHTIR
ncbi:alpha/beta hydrolase [Fictibacillus phosphorivorans]|uniref:Alpha/beta hydrolase n=1 Tax=Fictibacillus phosphorivorans TaxID=1221500 RepID=A0A160IKJ9_9BACL|nr:alpha/beta hydrolase [Fictibacillus phosphorivorans]ANC76377.1 alpha/beta hydrolase [Fictibacillus phosphorivorans]